MAFRFIYGDITKLKVEAIVNPTNIYLTGTGGADFAINQAAGSELLELKKTLPKLKTTEAALTPGFKLPSKFIIHVISPKYIGDDDSIKKLYQTYINALELARENKIKEIAFPLISAGLQGFPKQIAIDTAYLAIEEFLSQYSMDIVLVIFDEKTFNQIRNMRQKSLLEYIVRNYVEEKITPLKDELLKTNYMEISYSMDVAPPLIDIQESFHDRLNTIMIRKKLNSPDVWKKAQIDRKLFSKIFNGSKPKKQTAILITLALELNLDDSLDLLHRAGYTLSNAIKEDIVVKWHIENKIYSVLSVEETLFTMKLKTLQKDVV